MRPRDARRSIRKGGWRLQAVDEEARALAREKAALIYSAGTSVTSAVRRATTDIPVVFYVGTDPVERGLVDSFARPGGRFTGIHSQSTDLTAKRLEILKDLVPKLRRIVTFYDPTNCEPRVAGGRVVAGERWPWKARSLRQSSADRPKRLCQGTRIRRAFEPSDDEILPGLSR